MFSKIRILPKNSKIRSEVKKKKTSYICVWSKFRNLTWSVYQDMGKRLHFVHMAKNYRLNLIAIKRLPSLKIIYRLEREFLFLDLEFVLFYLILEIANNLIIES